jgi:glycerol uptake facilitator protein
MRENWGAKYLNEFIGTYLLVLFGNGAVLVGVIVGAFAGGLWDVSIVFGLGVTMAIYAVAGVSGAHLNPAVTIALSTYRGFPKSRIIPYVISQVAGGFAAAATYYGAYKGYWIHFEKVNNIVRGQLGSQLSAMPFHGFAPNPAIAGTGPEAWALVPISTAFLAEIFTAFLLVYFVFAIFDDKNPAAPKGNTGALVLGLLIAVLIAVEAPLTMTPINPARDFGPRLFAYLAGWGSISIPGPRGEFWLYLLGPVIGGLIAGFVYDMVHRRFLPGTVRESAEA